MTLVVEGGIDDLTAVILDRDRHIDLIAEVRIEFTGQGVIADKQGTGWATRLGDAVWPF